MIQQFYERLLPETPAPEPLSLEQQQELVRAALRLQRAVREYLYRHGSYGTHGAFKDGQPNHDIHHCDACSELQAALDEV